MYSSVLIPDLGHSLTSLFTQCDQSLHAFATTARAALDACLPHHGVCVADSEPAQTLPSLRCFGQVVLVCQLDSDLDTGIVT